jgi:hypothetical protein
MRSRFCIECKNFEDRTDIEGVVVCAKGHTPGISCPDFQDRTTDAFYSYIYWAYLYSTNRTDEGKAYWETRLSRRLKRYSRWENGLLKKQGYVKALTYRQDCFFAMAERCP